jgi:hypothetical protein
MREIFCSMVPGRTQKGTKAKNLDFVVTFLLLFVWQTKSSESKQPSFNALILARKDSFNPIKSSVLTYIHIPSQKFI